MSSHGFAKLLAPCASAGVVHLLAGAAAAMAGLAAANHCGRPVLATPQPSFIAEAVTKQQFATVTRTESKPEKDVRLAG